MELTILMPCLNEENSLSFCIGRAREFLLQNHICGEILIADNGSSDKSLAIARKEADHIVHVKERGYGCALRAGMRCAMGEYIIMGDADGSYDFLYAQPFLDSLRRGADLVVGDRFCGGMEPGAMPFSHKYIGNPMLSAVGRFLSGSRIHDFHCGMRGITKSAALMLPFCTHGMEFASEMIFLASEYRLAVSQVPITYHKDLRNGRSHLCTIRDGMRHVLYMAAVSHRKEKNHGTAVQADR